MLISNTLKRIFIPSIKIKEIDLLKLFLDIDKPDYPFSIHKICNKGRSIMLKEPGDWYGVNSIA